MSVPQMTREDSLAASGEAGSARPRLDLMDQMGHEIRTPLNGVVGMTELLLNTELSGEQREYATATMTSATALLVVINDVLDFAKLEAGTLELDAGVFEVRPLIENVRRMVAARAEQQGIALDVTCTDAVPAAVCGDGGRIRHVLTRLALSALKNTAEGRVEVRVSAGEAREKRVMLRIEVTDTGAGMSAGSLQSIFDADGLGPMADDRATALGLTVCRQLVELMGGEIGVESAVGAGSTFWFTTPVGIDGAMPYPEERRRVQARAEPLAAERVQAPPGEARPAPAAPSGPPRVLIADDDPVSQLVITRQLQLRGFVVDVARNGREAIEKHRDNGYDAIFMDCQMPELNGYQATVGIREAEEGTRRTPIIGMTASVRDADREQCLVSGMDDYVAKPLDQRALDAAIARRIPVYGTPGRGAGTVAAAGAGAGSVSPNGPQALDAGDPAVALLEGSVLTDVFRHNSESRSYLINVFVTETRTRIQQLAQAAERGDTKEMQRLTHALKGSAAAVGARRLEQLCREAHEEALAERISDADHLQGRLGRCLDMTAALLWRGCPQVEMGELVAR